MASGIPEILNYENWVSVVTLCGYSILGSILFFDGGDTFGSLLYKEVDHGIFDLDVDPGLI